MGLWIIILTVWLPITGIMLALCLYDMTRDMLEPAAERVTATSTLISPTNSDIVPNLARQRRAHLRPPEHVTQYCDVNH